MKFKFLLAVLFLGGLFETTQMRAQVIISSPCVPPHVTFTMSRDANGDIEVYYTSDKNYTPAIVSSSTIMSITFPTGYPWTANSIGSTAQEVGFNGSYSNGVWAVASPIDVAPPCNPGFDYLTVKLDNNWVTTLVANVPRKIFSFRAPPAPGCQGQIRFIENNDPYATSNGCSGTFSVSNYTAIAPGEGFLCDNFKAGPNPGVNCDQFAPLPVELISFTAEADGNTSLLEWSTATETNNKGFEVEHSTGKGEWTNIGWVDGNGTSSVVNNYKLIHEDPAQGPNYYRLKQFDTDDRSKYSEIKTIVFKSIEQRINAFPNPSPGKVSVSFTQIPAGEVRFELTDVAGRVVFQQVVSDFNYTLHAMDFSNLAPASYQLKVTHPGGEDHLPLVIISR